MALGPFYVAEKLREGKGVRGVALLMRHGETEWNRQGRVMGRNPIELDQRGRAQVESALSLARMLKPDLIVTSPLVRARQSAEIIASGLGGLEVIDEPQLEEVRYGSWEGMTYGELIVAESYLKYREDPLGNPTPGGESLYQVQGLLGHTDARLAGVTGENSLVFHVHRQRRNLVVDGDVSVRLGEIGAESGGPANAAFRSNRPVGSRRADCSSCRLALLLMVSAQVP